VSVPLFVTTAPADPDDHTAPTRPANITAESTAGFHLVRWDPSRDDLASPSFIRYDLYVNGELRAVRERRARETPHGFTRSKYS
jgi:hypothetical protein